MEGMSKQRTQQDRLKSSSEPDNGSNEINNALRQLVCLLANHAAREWYSREISLLSDKEPHNEQNPPSTTPDH